MFFHPFEVTIPHIAYLSLGGFVVLFGMFSLFLREKLYIGEACWAFIFGVIIGPYGAGIFNPRSWGGGSDETINMITLEFTRVVLAIGVFAIGVELPKAYMAKHWKSLFFLLVPVMTWGWFVSAGLIYGLIPGLNFLSSLAVAACLTPTDPILAAAVVGGKWADKHVPAHLRHLLAAESGCNDGAAFPFLFIALYLILDGNVGAAIRDWFLLLWLYQVIFGIVVGALLGFGFRYLMKFCQRHDLIDRHSYVAQYVSLAMLTIGVCTLLGSDDLLASFACGTAFAWDGFFNRQTEESVFSSVIDLLFNVAAFVFVGAWMPFNEFSNAELTLSVWRLIVIAILVLLLRRLPVMVALYKWIPDVKTFREAVFSGHFGPIGIGAVFISTLAREVIHKSHKDDPQIELLAHTIQPIVAFMVLCSITIHGLSISSVSLGRRVHSVSRTWSRHASLAPDWVNQARFVDRGAEIVINRDSQMEEGKLTPAGVAAGGRGSTRRSSGGAASDTASMTGDSEKGRGGDEGSVGSATQMEESWHHEREKGDGEVVVHERGHDPREEFPPDGPEEIFEWQEPYQRIVERRASPGEDLEVEVVQEEDPEPRPRRTSLSSSIRSAAGSLKEYMEAGVKKVEEMMGYDGSKEEQEGEQALPSGCQTPLSPPPPQTRTTLERPTQVEEDAGWVSDYSNENGNSNDEERIGRPEVIVIGTPASSPSTSTSTSASVTDISSSQFLRPHPIYVTSGSAPSVSVSSAPAVPAVVAGTSSSGPMMGDTRKKYHKSITGKTKAAVAGAKLGVLGSGFSSPVKKDKLKRGSIRRAYSSPGNEREVEVVEKERGVGFDESGHGSSRGGSGEDAGRGRQGGVSSLAVRGAGLGAAGREVPHHHHHSGGSRPSSPSSSGFFRHSARRPATGPGSGSGHSGYGSAFAASSRRHIRPWSAGEAGASSSSGSGSGAGLNQQHQHHPQHRISSARHSRIESIRAMTGQREASPARSIRFFDEDVAGYGGGAGGRSGVRSARVSQTDLRWRYEDGGEKERGEGDGEGKGRVTFDVPFPSSSGVTPGSSGGGGGTNGSPSSSLTSPAEEGAANTRS
ncbi:hypothetical protein AMATHDRAFT_5627 [Amanita thiersii Skay4041]|uniref:Cation/H+ exchanger transmembrane domain-containing protein n=1 Tax=Amanita thiersii Skay4041 TaxID=703135 RepID=A0A2A9NLH4_9AGAR|nr:hypothetical protein AMATHDRAFT_5627 [Amanita thiersii Skay4041]